MLKDDPSQTAISPANYKFSYKGAGRVQDRLVHVYQVKPHKKRPGLFKGRVYLDAHTGALVRAEGSVVKSPSFFVKHIEFWQDYTDVQSFTLPAHIHSEARARIVGRTIVDITHRDYQAAPAPPQQQQQSAQQAAPSQPSIKGSLPSKEADFEQRGKRSLQRRGSTLRGMRSPTEPATVITSYLP